MDEKELERRERLAERDLARHEAVHPGCNERYWYQGCQRLEAELVEARALITSLRTALEPFARYARVRDVGLDHIDDGYVLISFGKDRDAVLTLGDLRRTAEVWKEK